MHISLSSILEGSTVTEAIGEMKHKTAWRWWSKALGEKASKCDRESDKISLIRTFIFLTYLITNAFIIAGVVRHWNDKQHEIPSNLPETKEKIILKTSSHVL
jgi:hypothetical protein